MYLFDIFSLFARILKCLHVFKYIFINTMCELLLVSMGNLVNGGNKFFDEFIACNGMKLFADLAMASRSNVTIRHTGLICLFLSKIDTAKATNKPYLSSRCE